LQTILLQTTSELETLKNINNVLLNENTQLKNKLAQLMDKMNIENENTKKALEKAITSSIRLCVVAPTVNVHVADKKLKFKSGFFINFFILLL
jgi:regulator of replication initiation timing